MRGPCEKAGRCGVTIGEFNSYVAIGWVQQTRVVGCMPHRILFSGFPCAVVCAANLFRCAGITSGSELLNGAGPVVVTLRAELHGGHFQLIVR